MCKVSCLCFTVAASRRVCSGTLASATRRRNACRLSKHVRLLRGGSVSCGLPEPVTRLINSVLGRGGTLVATRVMALSKAMRVLACLALTAAFAPPAPVAVRRQTKQEMKKPSPALETGPCGRGVRQ